MEYRNVKDGRTVSRPYEDEWLEASAGWERMDAPAEPAESDAPDAGEEE